MEINEGLPTPPQALEAIRAVLERTKAVIADPAMTAGEVAAAVRELEEMFPVSSALVELSSLQMLMSSALTGNVKGMRMAVDALEALEQRKADMAALWSKPKSQQGSVRRR